MLFENRGVLKSEKYYHFLNDLFVWPAASFRNILFTLLFERNFTHLLPNTNYRYTQYKRPSVGFSASLIFPSSTLLIK